MIKNELFEKKQLLTPSKKETLFKYKLLFVSLIPPHYTTTLNTFAFTTWQDTVKLPNKYFIKQSYLIIAWFYHLRTIRYRVSSKQTIAATKPVIKFIVLPSRRTHYSLTKAPMAHKKNSKEQFVFKFYFILVAFHGLTDTNKLVPSCNAAISLLFIIQHLFPIFSTNILLSKTISISFTYSDRTFFNYYLFNNEALNPKRFK